MNDKKHKFENPARLHELKPIETLQLIGLRDDQTVCDIGAGSGIFTFPAARITKKSVYAVELKPELLETIGEKAKAEGFKNIQLVEAKGSRYDIESDHIDLALMVTVLHEMENAPEFLQEISRILKNQGKIAIIEFHKHDTQMGPPISHRLGKDELKNLMDSAGFDLCQNFDLGDNFYCMIFSINKNRG